MKRSCRRWQIQTAILFSIVECLFAMTASAASETLPTGTPTLQGAGITLDWTGDAAGHFTPRIIASPNASSPARAAVIIDVLTADQPTTTRLESAYRSIDRVDNHSLSAHALLTTAGGSAIQVDDRWTIETDTLQMERRLNVITAVAGDMAFGSGVEFSVPLVRELANADVFIPGLWYATAAHTPKSGLVTDLGQKDFVLREDRMSLPLVCVRDRASGWAITIEHRHPDGATIAADDNPGRVIDARLRFGSLGVRRDAAGLRVAFCFPGSEGQQTSIFGYRTDLRTAERLHAMTAGATQSYTIAIRLQRKTNFAEQMKDAWRAAYESASPQAEVFDASAVLGASIEVLNHFAYTKGTLTGLPFSASLPDGVVHDPSLQMGFVGQQLPCASYLIDEGIRTSRDELRVKGEKMVDFWASNSFSPKGVPRTWYDLTPQPHWRNYPTFLRVVTDGTSGMLRAWQIEHAAKIEKPAWLAFCRRVGDWLLKIQNPDGSFFREWDFDGNALSASKSSTLHPVRLLIDFSCATGEAKYREVALRAAAFALDANVDGANYVGGTPDNPDIIDKEAGWIAFDSYLALYDVTKDRRWLDAAVNAATFAETWIYAWNVPLPLDSTRISVPRVKTFVGTNLIASGHSGADNFLAYASLSFARLSIYTGDAHFAEVARLLQHNSGQFVDVAGSLNYRQPGLTTEAFTLAVNRGSSVQAWLPWCTSAMVEPMARKREAFGVIDIDSLLQLDPAERSKRNEAFAKSRGFTGGRGNLSTTGKTPSRSE